MKNNVRLAQLFIISFKNFLQRPWRNLIIAIAMSVGLCGVFLALGLGNGINSLLNSEDMKNQVPTTIQVQSHRESGRSLDKSDERNLNKIIGNKKERITTMQTYYLDYLEFNGNKFEFNQDNMPNYAQLTNLIGDVKESRKIDQLGELVAGKKYQNNREKGITITSKLLKDINKKSNQRYTAKSIIGKQVTIGMGETQAKYRVARVLKDGDQALYLSLPELDNLVKKSGQPEQISSFLIELKDSKDNKMITKKINKNVKYDAMTYSSILETMTQFIDIIQGLLIFMSSQASLVAVVLLGVVIFINVIERTKEIGIMKALGFQNMDISLIFIFEGIYIALISYLLSLGVAQVIGLSINEGVKEMSKITMPVFSLSLSSMTSILIATLLMVLIAVFIPIRKISRLDAAQSLRYE